MDVKLEWNKSIERIATEKTGGVKGNLFLANEAKRLMDPYVPASQKEFLAQNVRVYADDEAGYVEYNSPYAHYQYQGELYVSSVTGSPWAAKGEYKVPAGKKLKQDKTFHPLATDHWDKAMEVARKEELVKAYQRYLKRGAK